MVEVQDMKTTNLPIRMWAIRQTIVIFLNTEVQMDELY
ncbi:hypothetical protein NSP_44900 [Nodularia spumigena CCY9414]|nr:hypothetical protein NSP_44900 [Nodularia spumigena CCY9414]